MFWDFSPHFCFVFVETGFHVAQASLELNDLNS